MQPAHRIRSLVPSLFLLTLFTFVCIFGGIVAYHRLAEASSGSIDYSYFIQHLVRVFDRSLKSQLSINPVGHNMFFMDGVDGAPGLWHWIHFEPIKIIAAFIYTSTQSLLAAYGFYILLFFAPLLYGAFLVYKKPEHGALVALMLTAAAVYPSSLIRATDYLRPFDVLPSLFICSTLALLYRRPRVEKLFFLFTFLLVREEALVLSMGLLLWEWLRNRRLTLVQNDTILLTNVWAGWLCITFFYFLNLRYPLKLPVSAALFFTTLAIGVVLLAYALRWAWVRETTMPKLAPTILFSVLTVGPVLASVVAIDSLVAPMRLIYSRSGFFLFNVVIAIGLTLIVEHSHRTKRAFPRKTAYAFLGGVILLFLASELFPHPSSTIAYVSRWKAAEQESALVTNIASELPRDTPILLDDATMPMFYLHDNTYDYKYLPYSLTQKNIGREFPANRDTLHRLLSTSQIQYALVEKSSTPNLLAILQQEKRPVSLIRENTSFSFYRIQ